MKNGTWSKPSISCALSECYEEGRSRAYVGHRMCTSSGRQCQRWDTQEPQRHRFRKSEMFPDYSIQLADAFCRDPEGVKGFPWCFTTDPDKKWETCDIQKCSDIIIMDGSCGPLPAEPDDDKEHDIDEKKENKDEENKEKEEVDSKDKMDEDDGGGKDSLPICSSGHDLFQMQKDYRIRGKVINEKLLRSVVQCATLCSQVRLCRALTYRSSSKSCILHGGKDFTMIENRGYKAGVKACDNT